MSDGPMHVELPVIIGLLVTAIALAVAAKRVHVPYNVALVVGGMLVAVAGVFPEAPKLEPEIVFVICLPALLFEGGIAADLRSIRSNAIPIALLATVGLIISIAASGATLALSLQIPLISGLILGAVLSATDTVSVLYAFRRIAVPPRLSGLIQGESLFNDGTALVAYATLVSLVGGATPTIPALVVKILAATLGGIAVGLLLGFGAGFVIRWTEDPQTEIMTTTALAFAAYVLGEEMGVSGAIAAVTAGLTMGASVRAHSPPPAQMAIQSFWEYVAFGVNTFLFLSVGLTTRPESLLQHIPETALAVVCIFIGRAAGIYIPSAILSRFEPTQAIPFQWQHVFIIGNIKGALSIALALGLPAATPHRDSLIDVAFGVTFISLVGQGLLLTGALRRMGLVRQDPVEAVVADQQARLLAARAARQELETLYASGLVPRDGYERLRSDYQVTIAGAERELRKLHERHLAHGAYLLLATRRRLIDAERTALYAARRAGVLPESTAERMLAQIDARLIALDRIEKTPGDEA